MIYKLFLGVERAIVASDSAACRCFLYRLPRDLVLDTLLGPAEEFDYVSRTAPSSPPPTY